jgi:hypothetical protein
MTGCIISAVFSHFIDILLPQPVAASVGAELRKFQGALR